MVAEAQENAAEAQRWFAEAVRQGPRLPDAYVDWGKLLIHARRFDAAIPKLSRAAELSPNWQTLSHIGAMRWLRRATGRRRWRNMMRR